MNYKVVDVFSSKPLKGNPVAVVLDGSALSDVEMQDIARWTNLSETTFVVPVTEEGADYHVRIFTVEHELPFAGHPSLGTAHALLEAGLVPRKPRLVQQCKRGLVTLNVTAETVTFGIEISEYHPLSSADEWSAVTSTFPGLNLSPKNAPVLVNAGPHWIVAQLDGDEADLLGFEPDASAILRLSKQTNASGVCIFAPHSKGNGSVEVRTFAPACGVLEDPVCGSGQAAVAFYRNLGAPYTASQGTAVHRDGAISVHYGDGKVWVGGACVSVVDGRLNL